MPPEDEAARVRHSADGALQFYGAARVVELVPDRNSALVRHLQLGHYDRQHSMWWLIHLQNLGIRRNHRR